MNRSIVILASGGGSNADKILQYFAKDNRITVRAILSNRRKAGVHQVAKHHGVPSFYFDKKQRISGRMMDKIIEMNPDLIVLAGYLLKIPVEMVQKFPNRIVNIHPALLPSYGGKGMYGMHVHRAVIEAGEKISGITIHFVNENYDEGQFIKKVTCTIKKDFDAEKLQREVLKLEHHYYPRVIEKLLVE